MFTHLIFWLWFAGVVFLVGGLALARTELLAARGIERWIALGPLFVAAPLAVFAAEHFVSAQALSQIIPRWMPAHLFLTYFVGFAWVAAGISLATRKFLVLSSTLLGVMFLLIVLIIHLPNAIANPADRVAWIVVFRETSFAGGAWALAASQGPAPPSARRKGVILFGRFSLAAALIFFGVLQVLHPDLAPGVPDSKATPNWVPLHTLWGYPVGAILLAAGAALLINFKPRTAAASAGILMTLLTAFLYVPILAITRDVAQMTEAINFVADTLLFGGTSLLVARALSRDSVRPAKISRVPSS